MDIVTHIINFLKENETLVIPGLGRFTLTTVSATIHPVDNVFTPPAKTIIFESIAAQNDIMVVYIADHENISTAEATEKLKIFTASILDRIQSEKKCSIAGFGIFELNEERIIVFTADKALFADEFIGFTSFTSAAIARTTFKDKAALMAKQETEKKAKRKRRKKVIIIVFSIIILIASSALLYIYSDIIKRYISKEDINLVSNATTQDSTKNKIKTDTTNIILQDTVNVLTNDDTIQKTNMNTGDANYFIIAASFKSEENANKSVAQLKAKGYKEAGITHQKGNSMFIVYYQAYVGKENALKALQQIIKDENAESWLLKN